MKYNLNGSATQLRLEICAIQPDYKSMMECTHKLQEFNQDACLSGFGIALMMIGLLIIGFIMGRFSR